MRAWTFVSLSCLFCYLCWTVFDCMASFETLRATPAVAPKTRPLLLIWVLPLLLGAQLFCFNSNSSTQIWAPKHIPERMIEGTHSSVSFYSSSFFFLWTWTQLEYWAGYCRMSCTCKGREREHALRLGHPMEDGGCPVGPTGMGSGGEIWVTSQIWDLK